jgi:hypothetical protein
LIDVALLSVPAKIAQQTNGSDRLHEKARGREAKGAGCRGVELRRIVGEPVAELSIVV